MDHIKEKELGELTGNSVTFNTEKEPGEYTVKLLHGSH